MDKIWNPKAWPLPLHNYMPLLPMIQQSNYRLTTHQFHIKFIDYLVSICADNGAPVEVLQLSLSVASRYMNRNLQFCEPTQLLLLVSLFVVGKVVANVDGSWGCFGINELHKYSNHCFTNKDFYRLEKKILQQIGFDVLAEGICDRQVKLLLTLFTQIILFKITEDIQYVLWHYLFTKADKDRLCKKMELGDHSKPDFRSEKLLAAAIIQAGLVLCTQCVGRFPATVWMLHVLQLKEDDLSLCCESVLKVVLGREKFEELKL